jgi:enolase-phosphatase E1
LPKVLEGQWSSPALEPYIQAFPSEHNSSPEALEAHVRDLTARDVKAAPLKNLQGYLWEEGYKTGAYATPLYEDVIPFLEQFSGGESSYSRTVAIYSSGSIFAQKLLMQHIRKPPSPASTTENGREGDKSEPPALDRRDLIGAWFDTTTGMKQEKASYEKIVQDLKVHRADQILFLSDVTMEVRAALDAGMQSAVVVRPGNAELSTSERQDYVVIDSFDELDLVE